MLHFLSNVLSVHWPRWEWKLTGHAQHIRIFEFKPLKCTYYMLLHRFCKLVDLECQNHFLIIDYHILFLYHVFDNLGAPLIDSKWEIIRTRATFKAICHNLTVTLVINAYHVIHTPIFFFCSFHHLSIVKHVISSVCCSA